MHVSKNSIQAVSNSHFSGEWSRVIRVIAGDLIHCSISFMSHKALSGHSGVDEQTGTGT
jgi:hypothetical protein